MLFTEAFELVKNKAVLRISASYVVWCCVGLNVSLVGEVQLIWCLTIIFDYCDHYNLVLLDPYMFVSLYAHLATV